ncbi:H-2 class I histocompatibility antigen, Q10 alpha chain isoform X3 [Ailuropoda melanoleuca]|uniref:H-2 class I histocompatibility antigen, Q10 alpha chain isoform X3 n=1 Tax=Ailuropoda melanoleuca TaxID=9646 RepID=UPI0014941D14|nr:H-2 class I histocompatibility antigen, Q10 alpha chain isoform X3 [Ailuropoda melanoleuca]
MLLLLQLLGLVPERAAGTHSLHYHYLAVSEPGPGLPQFLAVGYVDDQPFIHYDSCVDRAKPQAPWMATVDAQYWETETQKQRTWAKVQQVETWTVMGYHNRSSALRDPTPQPMQTAAFSPACTGMHSTQRMFGCEIREDGRTSSFWQFGFDGQDHVSLDLETLSWVSAKPAAVRTKRWWETERCYAEYDKAYLEGLCLISLHRYLELGGWSLTRKEPPTVQVTRHTAQDGGITLKCWARGFYPRDISLSWWLGEEELVLETEYVETRPSGDGTYQTWAAVRVPARKEDWYTCHVQHSGLNHTLTVAWEAPSRQWKTSAVVVSTIFTITFLLMAGVRIFIKQYSQARNKESCKQAPGGEDPQNSQSPATVEATQLFC